MARVCMADFSDLLAVYRTDFHWGEEAFIAPFLPKPKQEPTYLFQVLLQTNRVYTQYLFACEHNLRFDEHE
jgi:hypothetical protein